ncbi:MAG: hypothetical protein ACI89W_001046 [Gammaproteobacteria bacterium]|jgi:hypothetical protein
MHLDNNFIADKCKSQDTSSRSSATIPFKLLRSKNPLLTLHTLQIIKTKK